MEGAESRYLFSIDEVLPWAGHVDVCDPLVDCGWVAALARLVGPERRLSDAGRGRDGFHAAVKATGPEDLGLLPDVVAELAAAGFGEVAVEPLWRNLDESTDVIRQCRAALGPCAGSLRE